MLLRYGMNPHQYPARIEPVVAEAWPVRVVSGEPSFINMLDALNAWSLVREATVACGAPAATSFKHVSPAGAALAGSLDAVMAETFGVDGEKTGALTSAYVRARDADPRASYGDLIAVSEPVDDELADLLRRLPSDGIIAPGYHPGTVETLAAKKNGRFLVLEADPDVDLPAEEVREVGGLRFTQPRDTLPLTAASLGPEALLPAQAANDLLLGLIVLRYTQSNSIAYLRAGMALGIGAGQQSRIDCTRLAGAKTDTWWLRRHPTLTDLAFAPGVRPTERTNWRLRLIEGDLDASERQRLTAALADDQPPGTLGPDDRRAWLDQLDHVALASDGAIPFRDNIDHAARHGVRYVAEPGGSTRSPDVEQACAEHGITRIASTPRLFHH